MVLSLAPLLKETGISNQEIFLNCAITYLFLSFSYFLGGGSLFAIHNECEVYNPRSDRWASLCPMTSRRSRAGVTSLGKLLYVVGGYVMHFIFHLVIHFVHLHILRAQSFTSLMEDLYQDINRVFHLAGAVMEHFLKELLC